MATWYWMLPRPARAYVNKHAGTTGSKVEIVRWLLYSCKTTYSIRYCAHTTPHSPRHLLDTMGHSRLCWASLGLGPSKCFCETLSRCSLFFFDQLKWRAWFLMKTYREKQRQSTNNITVRYLGWTQQPTHETLVRVQVVRVFEVRIRTLAGISGLVIVSLSLCDFA